VQFSALSRLTKRLTARLSLASEKNSPLAALRHPAVLSKHPLPHNFPDNPSSPPCLPTEFHLAQYDLARRWFLRLFELEVGFDPSAAIPAHRRPHWARGLAIYRAWIYLGRHF
jgi:hypothetical protein